MIKITNISVNALKNEISFNLYIPGFKELFFMIVNDSDETEIIYSDVPPEKGMYSGMARVAIRKYRKKEFPETIVYAWM